MNILNIFHPNACTLKEFLSTLPGGPINTLHLTMEDNEILECLSTSVRVAIPPTQNKLNLPHISIDSCFSQSEIVNRVIELLLNKSIKNNLMTLGYGKLSGRNTGGIHGMHGIENYFPNTLINYLKSYSWELLLSVYFLAFHNLICSVGESVMSFLLLQTKLYCELENQCYFQLNGIPSSEHQTFHEAHFQFLRKRKCTQEIKEIQKRTKQLHTHYSNVMLFRSKMFYGKAFRNRKSNFIFGFPRDHIIHKMNKQHVKEWAPLIFNKQFKENGTKMPWRLKSITSLLCSLEKAHQKTNYAAILNYYCPSVHTIHLHSDISYSNHYTPIENVLQYIFSILKRLCPVNLWGCQANLTVIRKKIELFVRFRRYESLSLHQLLQGIQISQIHWLEPPLYKTKGKPRHIPPSDMEKRMEIFSEFLFWFFDSLIIPLIKTNFYVTETGNKRNAIYYFRQDVWNKMTSNTYTTLSSSLFYRMDHDDLSSDFLSKTLGYSYIRLLPKEIGFRPIANLKRRQFKMDASHLSFPVQKSKSTSISLPSINSVLQNTYQILCYERDTNPELLGSSVFGMNDIYKKIIQFKSVLGASQSKLYFCKVDVKSCFDFIDQVKLLNLVTDILNQEEYIIQKYSSVYTSSGILKRSFTRKADSSEELTDFENLSKTLSQQVKNTIFMDQVVYPLDDRQDVLQLLESHISYNLIKIAKKYYKQRIGIPQGSILSTILCSFYYAEMEKRELGFLDSQDSLLLRYVDDFLLITTDKQKAVHFMVEMQKGFPEYGCFTNLEKCCANFKIRIDDIPIKYVPLDYFPWCGYLIHTKSLEIQSDYTKLLQSSNLYLIPRIYYIGVSDLLSIEWNNHPGAQFKHKMIQSIKIKLHSIFLNTSFNSVKTVYTNVYMNFRSTAIKFLAYSLELNSVHSHVNVNFLYKTIVELVDLVDLGVKRFAIKGSYDPDSIPWLGFHAFKIELSRHYTNSNQFNLLLDKVYSEFKKYKVKCKSTGLLFCIVKECNWLSQCQL